MIDECLAYVNKCSESDKIINRLHGLKKINGQVFGRILPHDEDLFWLPIHQLCNRHEEYISKWLKLGGKIEDD